MSLKNKLKRMEQARIANIKSARRHAATRAAATRFNTGGTPRITRRTDGYYVVGNGEKVGPVQYEEGLKIVARMKGADDADV